MDELSYLAGFFDGEGTIIIERSQVKTKQRWRNRTYYPLAQVTNVKFDAVERYQIVFGGYIRKRVRGGNSRDIYDWKISSRGCYKFLKVITPFLRLKKLQAQFAMAYYDDYGKYFPTHKQNGKARTLTKEELERREGLYQQIKKLNKVGRN